MSDEPRFSRWLSSEVKANVYDGPTHDGHRNYFETYCEGDMGSDQHDDPITLKVSDFPPGTRIHVELPCCPACGLVRRDTRQFIDGLWKITGFARRCDCGFNWKEWTEEQYS